MKTPMIALLLVVSVTAAPLAPTQLTPPVPSCGTNQYLCTLKLQALGSNCMVGSCVRSPPTQTPPTPPTKAPPTQTPLWKQTDQCRAVVQGCVNITSPSTNTNSTNNTSTIETFFTMMKCVKARISDQTRHSECTIQMEDSMLDSCSDEFSNCYTKYKAMKADHNRTGHTHGHHGHTHDHPSFHMDGPCPMKFIRGCISWTHNDFSEKCSDAVAYVQERVQSKKYQANLPTTVVVVQQPLKSLLQYQWLWGAEITFDPQLPAYNDDDNYHYYGYYGESWMWLATAVGFVVITAIMVCIACVRRRRLRAAQGQSSDIPTARMYSLPYTALPEVSAMQIPMAAVVQRVPVDQYIPAVPVGQYMPVAQSQIPMATPVYYN